MVNPFGKSPNKITEDDLKECLGDFAESWVVEYKGPDKWDDNVGIAKSIASFANTYGGWLFIGINADDDNKPDLDNLVGVAKECGMPERLYQIAASHLSPGPYFLCHPVELANGNVVVANCINESPSPPHIHVQSGVIPMRSGNTTDPVEPLRDRAKLDQLHGKADRNKQAVADLLSHHHRAEKLVDDVMQDHRGGGSNTKADAWWVCLIYPSCRIDDLLPYVLDRDFPICEWPGRDMYKFATRRESPSCRFTKHGVCVLAWPGDGYYIDVFGHIAFCGLFEVPETVTHKCSEIRGTAEAAQALYKAAGYWGEVQLEFNFRKSEQLGGPVVRTASVHSLPDIDVDSVRDEVARAIHSWDRN